MTSYEFDALAVPRKILSVEIGIVDGNVFTLPKTVFCGDFCVVYLNILAILEHVFRIRLQAVYINVFAKHERVGAFVEFHILYFQSADFPKSFVGVVDFYVFEAQVAHLAKKLRAVNHAVSHHHVIAVPYSRAAAGSKIAVLYYTSVNMPPRIFSVEF